MNIFLDSSVAVAASLSATGASREVFNHAARQGWHLFVSPWVLREVRDNLANKPPEASVKVSFAFRKFSVIALFFDIVSELIVLPPVGSVSVPAIATLSVEDAPEMLPVNSDAPGSIRIPLES